MKHASTLIAALAAGLMFGSGAVAAEPADSNLGPAVVAAGQTSIFGETEEEQRRNAMITAGVIGAVVLGVVLLDDDSPDQPGPGPEPMPHHSAHH